MPLASRCVASALAIVLFTGCTTLKRWAYDGFDRDSWQQPERVIEALEIQPGDVVADLGSGGGYFTFRLAEAVGVSGKVYAVDVDRGLLDYVADQARERGAGNVEVILAQPHSSGLPEGKIDLLFTSDTYHHLPDQVRYFAEAKRSLSGRGRVAILELLPSAGWFHKLFGHSTEPEQIRADMEQAGYRLEKAPDFLSHQSLQVFVPKQEAEKQP